MKNTRLQILLYILSQLCIVSHSVALDPHKAISQYIHSVWQTEEGLPQIEVKCITQTRDGYLWIGTNEGLLRFDGSKFTIFDKSNTKGIGHNSILSMLQTRDGTFWVGTEHGLTRMKDGEFISYLETMGIANKNINDLYEDRKGNFWIATNDGLGLLKDGKFTAFTTKNGFPTNDITSITGQDNGNIYIGTSDGLVKLVDGTLTTYTTADGLSDNNVRALYVDASNILWVGTNSGLCRFMNGKWKTFMTKDGLVDDRVRSICKDKDGNLWIGTNGGGLSRIQGTNISSYTTYDGLIDGYVSALHEDKEGNLWIGTVGGGLNRFTDRTFTFYGEKEGLSQENTRAIYETRDGAVWVGADIHGMTRFKNGKLTVYVKPDIIANYGARSFCEDIDGSMWIGTYGGGLCKMRADHLTVYTTRDGLGDNKIFCLIMAKDSALWIGTRGGGFSVLKNGKLKTYTTSDGLSNNSVRSILEAKDGSKWICTDDGLTHYKNGMMTKYTTDDGLSYNTIFSIFEDEEQTLWIGTYGGGLNRFKDGKFTPITTKQGMYDNAVFKIIEDNQKYFWMTCNRGIYRVSEKELNDYAEGKIQTVHCRVFGTADGMMSAKCNGSCEPAGICARDGRLWIPTMKGVVIVDPSKLSQSKIPPPVFIEQIMFDGLSMKMDSMVQIAPGSGKLEFHYTALDYSAPNLLYFKYMLTGFDKNWIDAGTQRVAYYTNIPPGNYTFTVIACNNEGLWNLTGASIKLNIAAHFYQTAWFFGLIIVAIGSLAYWIVLFRINTIRRHELELVQTVDERTKNLQQEIGERKRTESALRESEERYRRLVEYSPDTIAVHIDGKFVYVNKAAVKLVGAKDESQLIGRPILDIIHPGSLENEPVQVFEENKNQAALPPMEKKFIRLDGGVIDVEVTSMPIIYQGRSSTQIIARNITEQKKLREQLLQSQKIQSIGTLAGGIAHDFNNILGIIIGYVSLLAKRRDNPQKHAETVAAITQASERGAALVRQILTFARKAEISFQPLNISELIDELLSMLKQTFPKTITFVSNYPERMPDILGDRTQIHQAVLNLCVNARDAMPNGGIITLSVLQKNKGEVRQRFTSANQERYLCINVTDTGMGMSEEVLQRIFDPFFTTKEKGKGTGLGLSVVYGVMQAHHGFVDVTSHIDYGTTFSLFLPMESIEIVREVPVPYTRTEIRGGSETIMVVEDEYFLLDMVQQLLESKGYHVLTAQDGIKALDVYSKNSDIISLVLTDIGLPNMNGGDLLRKLKELNPHITVILASGYFEPDIRAELQRSGAKGFIQKPYLPDQILQRIREELDAL